MANPNAGAKKKKKKVVGTMPTAMGVFDPTVDYGRDKKQAYLNTSLGHRDINKNHEGYYNMLLARGGVNAIGGAQPFHQWLTNTRFNEFEQGYDNARMQNPKLSFAHYMQTTGVPGNANNFVLRNTGNSFTSTSAPVFEGSVKPTLTKDTKGKGKKGKTKDDFSRNAFPAAGNVASLDAWMAGHRNAYAKLTPEQSGEYMAGYTMGPARWSVYG